MSRAAYRLACVLGLLLLTSCAAFRHEAYRVGEEPTDPPEYALRFIEVDDEGWFWDPSQATAAIELIEQRLRTRDTLVITFVHGWHHSARCCDDNVEGFRETLSRLRKLARERFDIVGLYVGWRGQSLPGSLDYLTFWGRKSAAERVGSNDFKEFLTRLQLLYAQYRPDAAPIGDQQPPDTMRRFMGMVTIGHSFGGQVVLKAVAESIENQLQQINSQPAYLRGAKPADPQMQQPQSIAGLGDLVVLVNPAAEASQYHRLHILSQGMKYLPLQTPLILTVSAENDRARKKLFTVGRTLGEFFTRKPRKSDPVQRQVEREALGVYAPHVTHKLIPVDPDVRLQATTVQGDPRNCAGGLVCQCKWYQWRAPPQRVEPDSLTAMTDSNVESFDFSQRVVFNNVELSPLDEQDFTEPAERADYGHAQPHQPLIVARTSKQIIDNHSGFFTEPFLKFLVPYIAFIEVKSYANVESNRNRRQEAPAQLSPVFPDSGD
jgi:hypothetical protein